MFYFAQFESANAQIGSNFGFSLPLCQISQMVFWITKEKFLAQDG
jgi:hypothetical protein